MNRNTLIILLAVCVAVVSVAGSSLLLEPINTQRQDLQLTFNPDVTENLPPEVGIWYSALGSFRGLFVNMLWMRATALKEEGKFYEAKELSEIICQLQPRFPQVWAFHSWNMAYNISVATHTQRERWMWVRNGIELLRDFGIPLNPTSAPLYRQLAWIYLHKVGQFSDDMHWYYKRQLALEWQAVLGQPPAGSTRQTLDWFRPVAEFDARYFGVGELDPDIRQRIDEFVIRRPDAADMLRDLRALTPEAFDRQAARLLAEVIDDRDTEVTEFVEAIRAMNAPALDRSRADPVAAFLNDHPEVRPLLADLRSRGLAPDRELLERIGRSIMLLDAMEAGYDFGEAFGSDPVDQFLFAWLGDANPEVAALRDQVFLPFLRAKVLREHYRMNPSIMLDIMEGRWLATDKYPDPEPLPLDWRHPAAHGLYWSALGVRAAQPRREKNDQYFFEILNTDRQVLHALQALMHNGQIVFDPLGNYYEQLPDARFVDGYEKAVYGAGPRIGGLYADSAAIESFEAGHENFLKWAIGMLYFSGDETGAQELYDKLANTYAHKPGRAQLYTMPLGEFVMRDIKEDITSVDTAKNVIDGLVTRALINGYFAGRPRAAQQALSKAREVHEYYQNKQGYVTLGADRNRMALQPWGAMLADTLTRFLTSPPGAIPLGMKQRVWRNIPDHNEDGSINELKQRVWDRVRQPLAEQVQRAGEAQPGGLSFAQRFPEPPGMDEYRKARQAAAPPLP